MSPILVWLTAAAFLVPAAFLAVGARTGQPVALVPGGGVLGLYLFIWLYLRPTRFEISSGALDIVWPARRETIPLTDVERAEVLTRDEFRARFGWGLRVGSGGLWGGFGLLVTRGGTLRFYVSRIDRFVLVVTRTGRPLLITPSDPQGFVRTLAVQTLGE